MKHSEFYTGASPIVITAIHDGHAIRSSLRNRLKLSEFDRMREEDPYTDFITETACSRIVVRKSRFEVDLNRPPALKKKRRCSMPMTLQYWPVKSYNI